ncbi:MAG: phosphotransferase, partial [Clostridia bacterium]
YVYLSNVASIQIAENTQHLYLAGKGFGQFQRLLNGFKAESLSDTIKDFHNTPKRYKDFVEAVNCDAVGRLSTCREEVDFYLSRQSYASRVTDLLASGKIPLRVTHNDTKINNVLIDIFDNYPVAVIDLDTVMSGSILYDFGDSIRSGTNIGAEDEADLDKVGFSIDLFSAYAKGFMSEVSEILTSAEVDNLAFSGILLTYECGMRFLGDYLNGDKYFKTHREGHNLDRARTQIKMISDMEQQLPDMEKIIKSVL